MVSRTYILCIYTQQMLVFAQDQLREKDAQIEQSLRWEMGWGEGALSAYLILNKHITFRLDYLRAYNIGT